MGSLTARDEPRPAILAYAFQDNLTLKHLVGTFLILVVPKHFLF